MKPYRIYIALAVALVAIASVAVASRASSDKPSWIDAHNWIELGDGFGIVVTTQPSWNREKILEDMRSHVDPDSTGSVELWVPDGMPGEVYGYMMVRRSGSWFRFQPEPGPPRTLLIR